MNEELKQKQLEEISKARNEEHCKEYPSGIILNNLNLREFSIRLGKLS